MAPSNAPCVPSTGTQRRRLNDVSRLTPARLSSCSAFGPELFPTDDGLSCKQCRPGDPSRILAISAAIGLVAISLSLLFVAAVMLYPVSLQLWVSTATIVINHCQTFTALAALNLEAPQLLREIAAVQALRVPHAICLVQDADAYRRIKWLMALLYCLVVLTTLFGLLMAQWVAHRIGYHKRADQLEQLLSIVFSLQLTTTWLVCLTTFRTFDLPPSEALGTASWLQYMILTLPLATCTFLLQLGLLARFATAILWYHRGVTLTEWSRLQLECSRWLGTGFLLLALPLLAAPVGLSFALLLGPVSSLPPWLLQGLQRAFWPSLIAWPILAVAICGCSVSGLFNLLPSRRERAEALHSDEAPRYGLRARSPLASWMVAICHVHLVDVAPRTLGRRVRYLTGRFAVHAPRWQLVIWLRQLTLLLLVTASKLASSGSFGDEMFLVRYVTAAGALCFLNAFWWLHHTSQPYAFHMQNALENWLYASNVLLLLLAIGYTALAQQYQQQHSTTAVPRSVRVVIEALMLVVLVGGWLVAARYMARSLRATRQSLAEVIDVGTVLAIAESSLDDVVRERLGDGTVQLLRCDWLVSAQAEDSLARDALTGAVIMRRRQELPAEAFLLPSEAERNFTRGDRSVLVLSHAWQTALHPDPHGCARRPRLACRRFCSPPCMGPTIKPPTQSHICPNLSHITSHLLSSLLLAL